jgi:YD repeat-containing protein
MALLLVAALVTSAAPEAGASPAPADPVGLAIETPGPAQYLYDAVGKVVGVVQAAGAAGYAYDAAGNITEVRRYPASQLSALSVVPSSAPPGAAVTIHGTGFTAVTTATLNGIPAPATLVSATALRVTVPSGATTGAVAVSAAGTTVSGPTFTVAAPTPTITGVSPAGGAPSTVVTIIGSGFDPDVADDVVTFGGARAEVTAVTPTRLTVTVPLLAQTGRVAISTPAGQARWATDFLVPIGTVDPTTVESVRRVDVGGAAVAVPVAAAGKVALLLFDAPESGRVDIAATASTFGGAASYDLYSPTGKQIASRYGSDPAPIYIASLTPGQTYQLVVDPSGTLTGQATVTVSTPVVAVR